MRSVRLLIILALAAIVAALPVTNIGGSSRLGSDRANLVASAADCAPEPDPDTDGFGNECDNCPTVSNSTQANVDGDSLGDACDNSDSDSGPTFFSGVWMDAREIYLGTLWDVKCPSTSIRHDEGSPSQWNDAWPADMDDNRAITGQDMLAFINVINNPVSLPPTFVPGLSGSVNGPHPPRSRFDFTMNGVVSGADWLAYTPILGTTCS